MLWYAVQAPPLRVGDTTVTARSRVVGLRLARFALVWHFPTGIDVERAGQLQRMAIVNITLYARLVLVALTVLAAMAGRWRRS
ncbi:MAG: hypothetical protein M3336_12410 [Chloroflexota bacterium]|nr:hypothetical protein [Chloroflexota bacterium]